MKIGMKTRAAELYAICCVQVLKVFHDASYQAWN